jgi:methyltransferase (TIGR00027 family)
MPALNAIARTAFYCCALRARDAESARPVCNDHLAHRFLDDETRRELAPVLAIPGPAAGNVARHRIIDDLLRTALQENPARRIIILGAGFDTRAFRLAGGRWWEIDDPALLAVKEERLPAATAPNPLVRLPLVVGTDSLAERLAPLTGEDDAIVIVEGVCMYVADDALQAMASTIRAALPRARLVLDLMSPAFNRRFSGPVQEALGRLGATFATRQVHPRLLFEAAGYHAISTESVIERARREGTVPIPRWLLATFYRTLRDGYAIWVFAPPEVAA